MHTLAYLCLGQTRRRAFKLQPCSALSLTSLALPHTSLLCLLKHLAVYCSSVAHCNFTDISYSSPLFCCHISPAEGFHRVCRCVKNVHNSVPDWGLIFFGSDRFTAFRVKATADVHWDVFVPSFRADCDFYQTLKVSGWSLQHCNAGRVVVAWQARLAELNAALPTRAHCPAVPGGVYCVNCQAHGRASTVRRRRL